jgi:glycosyltransferase involved in cell wall biosynthesis
LPSFSLKKRWLFNYRLLKILVLSHKPPYPILDGGCLAMARLLADLLSLKQVTEIRYHTLATAKHPYQATAFPAHEKLSVQHHPIDTKVTVLGAAISLLKQESYNLKRFKKSAIIDILKEEIHSNSFDIVIFESLFAAAYASLLRPYSKAKFIYRAHNIEHQIWKDLAVNSKFIFKKWYLHQLAYSLKWAERSIWSEDQGGLDLILTISDTDLGIIEGQTLSACRYLPASILKPTIKSDLAPQKICFLGAFNWTPNVEAVDWFLKAIFPALKQQFAQLEFHIAGKGSEIQKHWQQPGVVLHGFVPDAKAFIATHGIFAGCLQSGSGVKMKIIEALSVGAPIVFSSKSADGLPAFPQDLINTTGASFQNELMHALENEAALQKRAQFATAYFEQHFEAAQVQKQLLQILEELQNNR